MPVLIAIIFGIGLLLVANPEKLPWFLQIIRAGLLVLVRWAFVLIFIGSIIGLCVWGYRALTKESREREEAEIARKAYIADSLNQVRVDSIQEIEYKKQEIEKENEAKDFISSFVGSWGRNDNMFGIDEKDDDIYTFKKNFKFYTKGSKYNSPRTGSYKIDYTTKKLYLYFDGGRSEYIHFTNLNNTQMEGIYQDERDRKVVFLKRPNT